VLVIRLQSRHCTCSLINNNVINLFSEWFVFTGRKWSEGSYGLENIKQAVEAVSSGTMSKREAEAVFGVPTKGLGRHLKDQVIKPGKLGRYDCALGSE